MYRKLKSNQKHNFAERANAEMINRGVVGEAEETPEPQVWSVPMYFSLLWNYKRIEL